MARLNDDAQWIVLMGFIVSFALFFIAILINQSTIVGQTTAEAVSEFPKTDIREVRGMIIQSEFLGDENDKTNVQREIRNLSLSRHNAVVEFSSSPPAGSDPYTHIEMHYNNGVTAYNETWRSE
ncbi:hypothetical protein [Methanoregula sp.]|uniref:hypothetical protein n=1 Tax=Methanoregula sp. TaxID=2052170 RepID=UPI000CB8C281|nr:hypothetical protein [Methanoregula sp.]PKG33552.1 MAG: hypothetical protein CW742_02375 [Methanoregula sp.]